MTATSTAQLPWVPGLQHGDITRVIDLPGVPAGTLTVVTTFDPEVEIEADVAPSGAGLLEVQLRASRPVRATFVLLYPTRDAIALWTPGSGTDRGWLPPSWGDAREISPLDGVPIVSLLGRDDLSQLCVGVRTERDIVVMRAGLVEETAHLMLTCELDLDTAGSDVLLDLRSRPFAEAVPAMGAAMGLSVEPRGPRHEEPVLCTWYSLHQDVDTRSLTTEGRLGAELGFRTMIVDDGWQTHEGGRGYSSCGDWEVDTSKIADPADLVGELREAGLAVMWWIGTPFLGYRAQARSAELAVLKDEPSMEAGVLDPRSLLVREMLLQRLTRLVSSTGVAGLKIDFLERWARTPAAPAPADAVCASVPEAGLSFLGELAEALSVPAPDTLLEFREPYVGAAALPRATMLRVGDCPMSPRRNRIGIVDLRLLTNGIAIHADPVMWAPSDTPERVAQHLHATAFGVPQVSVRLEGMSEAHRRVLAHWLTTWRRLRSVLLHGELSVAGVGDGYREVTAVDRAIAVTVQYATTISRRPPAVSTWVVVSAHDASAVLVDAGDRVQAQVEVTDCEGEVVSMGAVELEGVTVIEVPPGGAATIEVI